MSANSEERDKRERRSQRNERHSAQGNERDDPTRAPRFLVVVNATNAKIPNSKFAIP